MTKLEQAARQALGALVRAEAMYGQPNADIQTALREALAEQAEQEPVAWRNAIKHWAFDCAWGDLTERQIDDLELLVTGVINSNSPPVEPVKQVPPSLDDDEAEKRMATPKQEKCECVVKRLIFSGDREYCETCGWPIYTFEEHRARLLEERK